MTTPVRPLRLPRYPLPTSPTSTSDWHRSAEPIEDPLRCRECGERGCRHDDDTDPTLPPEGPLQFEE